MMFKPVLLYSVIFCYILCRSRSGTPAGTTSAPVVAVETTETPAIVEHPAEAGVYASKSQKGCAIIIKGGM